MEAAIVTGETAVRPLAAEQLYRPTDLSGLVFSTTAELQPIDGLVGQARAVEAIRFGTQVGKAGFNLFVIGPNGARMQDAVKAMLTAEAAGKPAPSDWVYVHNFADPGKPIAIELPAGRAREFHNAMHKLIDDLKSALPAVFQSEDYQTRQAAIDESFQKRQGEAFSALRDKAAAKDIAVLRTPLGFALAPVKDGKVVPPDEFSAWPEARRREVQAVIETLEKDLEHIIRQVPQWETQRRDETRQLNRDTAKYAVDQLIEDAKAAFNDIPRVVQFIETVRADLVENVGMFVVKSEDEESGAGVFRTGSPFDRYEVNVLVTQYGDRPVPIIEELHPALGNLIGRIEYIPLQGALLTNFRLIKAGAVHRANGGYLLLDARSVLLEPFSWAALKRTLRRGEVAIEDIGRFLGLTSTVSLEPDPIPLKLKVILFGDRLLYFLLAALDPELAEHFKVLADFENDLPRTAENEIILARLVATIAQREGLNALDRDAVAFVLEHAARSAEHSGKLSLVAEQLREILIEADFCAREAKRSVISRADVNSALVARIRRAARLRDRTQEAILEKVALIDTVGAHVGQINGLSVTELGGFSFGRPTRITCQARPGSGKVVDIEREVELGGPLHSKGVLILSGFVAGRYATDTPMSLFASLVFEQSYGGVEGDSASSAELYAILSALADVPLRQDLAVTGSVNQHGEIQAIGGVNEKIEGFFDICEKRGLTGTQGVLIPQANVQHLMLRKDVTDACTDGRFAVYPVATINEGIALLTGIPAGVRGPDGAYPPGSVNRRVEDRLRAFASIRRDFISQSNGGGAPAN
ncbi:AAA family ATPase [Bradyrhizobium sediminis]|uniref:endopeptidase La n=1 Tax=Bradyrhizobium sediminis TaxID=2840469 RepID=A0A975NXG5_9BRAD|nr:ATP-binding protein [Bradyrhizobium sediminis]QWG22775.1 AAA family ATPase [Bradyrhizobium sediminis]